MRRLLTCLALGLTLQAAPALALDDAEQKLLDYQIAMAIDAKCHFFKHFELDHTYPVSSNLIDSTSWGAAFSSGKFAQEEYDARYRAIEEQAAAAAAAIACTDQQTAARYIVPLRGELASAIYANLLIAFEHGHLTPEQQEAARRYEAMIAPLYAQNWQGFVQYAQNHARIMLEAAQEQDAADDIYGFSMFSDSTGLSGLFADPYADGASAGMDFGINYNWNFGLQVKSSVRVVNDILFEVVAESQGLRLIARREPGRAGYVESLVNADFAPQLDLIDEPAPYVQLEGGPEVQIVMVIRPDGEVRVMTFGQEAAELKAGSVVLMVQPEALPPELASNYAHLTSQEWWNTAREFRGELVSEACLGGPCFAMPRDIVDALLAGGQQQSFRFYLSGQADVAPPAFDNPAIQTGYSYQVRARQEYLSAGQ